MMCAYSNPNNVCQQATESKLKAQAAYLDALLLIPRLLCHLDA
jgi:hypothetical protein